MDTEKERTGGTLDDQRLVKVSRYLAKHLRHQPERLGIELEPGGWVAVEALLVACRHAGFALSHTALIEVVERNDKQRFGFDATGTRIRASQGHSVAVDLQLSPAVPPAVLYHGTGAGTLEVIFEEGLRPMGRHHVHLSSDRRTAHAVGARHGAPVVLRVAADRLHAAGSTLVCSDNGVWLTGHVPVRYLEVTDRDHAQAVPVSSRP
jgi:putative RNA 2'-phosphotransferase